MSRMKDVYTDLTEGIQSIDTRLSGLEALQREINSRLTCLVYLEDQIKNLGEELERRLARMEAAQVDSSKLVDRVIEMSLVNRGEAHAAAVHRAQSRLETNFSSPQSWVDDEEKDEVWPPPGCDAMDIVN